MSGDHASIATHEDLSKLLNHARTHSYAVGPSLILGVLAESEPSCQDARELVGGGLAPQELSRERAFALIHRALGLDLSVFLKGLFNLNTVEPGCSLDGSSLFLAVSLLASRDASSKQADVISRVFRCVRGRDRDSLVKLVREVVGMPMDHPEIEAGVSALLSRRPATALDAEVMDMVRDISHGMTTAPDSHEWLRWVMTYVLEPEDYIDDHHAFIGYLDDYYVLAAARIMDPRLIPLESPSNRLE